MFYYKNTFDFFPKLRLRNAGLCCAILFGLFANGEQAHAAASAACNQVNAGAFNISDATSPNEIGFSAGETVTTTGTGSDADNYEVWVDGGAPRKAVNDGVNPFSFTFLATGNMQVRSNSSNNTITATCTAASSATTTSVSSSNNPSTLGQSVTFTATVSGTGPTPTGTITFMDGATTLGTGTLNGSGQATFATTTLTIGSHSITAVYGGDVNFTASTSTALVQVVGVPADSIKLQALQAGVTKLIAQGSGLMISGAIDSAVAEGFNDGGELVTPTANGVRINFAAEPTSRSAVAERADDAFAALGYVGRRQDNSFKVQPRPQTKEWLGWAEVRGTNWTTGVQAGDIRGGQTNALAGLTRKVSPDFLLGAFGGYERFDYTSQALIGRLRGDGWTVGAYLGWRLLSGLRFDAGVARSGLTFDGQAGAATGAFRGQRWLASAGLTGTVKTANGFVIEPSAKVYALWEREDAYVDSLSIQQAAHNFSTGRMSAGVKASYPVLWSSNAMVSPYAGIYADYHFNTDNAVSLGAPNLLPAEYVHGLSARVTSGLAVSIRGGPQLSIGGELGGLGNDFKVLTVRGRVVVPF